MYIETRRKTQCMQSGVNAITRTGDYKCHIYLRKYLIKIWCVLYYRRHHTFNVKTCFQQSHERYLFSVFRGILSAIFRRFSKKLKASPQSCTRKTFYQIIKINKTQILLKYFLGDRGVKFLEKRRENVQILQVLRWCFDV